MWSIFNPNQEFDLAFYRQRLQLGFLLYLLLELTWRLVLQFSRYSYLAEFQELVSWALRLVLAAYVIWQVKKNLGAVERTLLLLALAVGFWPALIKLFFNFRFWTIINVVTEPILTAAVYLAIYYLINKVLKINR